MKLIYKILGILILTTVISLSVYLIFKFFFYIICFLLIISIYILFSIKNVIRHIRSNEQFINMLLNSKSGYTDEEFLTILKDYVKESFKYNILARNILIKTLLKEANKEEKYSTFDYIFALKTFNIHEEDFENMTIIDIKKIYKDLAKINHPDLNKEKKDDKMKDINRAKEILISLKNI